MPVDRSDHGDGDGLRRSIEMLRILVRPEAIIGAFRKVADHLAEALVVRVEVRDAPLALHRHLLLKERMQHDGRPSRVLETLDGVDAVAEWRCTGDERMREAHSEI